MLAKKILIIDDDRMIRLTTGMLLAKHNVQVLYASNGNEGVAMAKIEKPELILLDIMMPGMDGWQVLDEIRSDPQIAHIPVAIFTAGDYIAAEVKAKERNIRRIIRKPFRLNDFLKNCEIPERENNHE